MTSPFEDVIDANFFRDSSRAASRTELFDLLWAVAQGPFFYSELAEFNPRHELLAMS